MGNTTTKAPKYEYGTKRQGVKRAQLGYVHSIMETFDKTRTGALNRDEVRELCTSIVSKVAPNIGVLESDIDMVMLVGGKTIKPEITVEEIPMALSAVLALQSENAYFHELFQKYDTDKSGSLPKDQLCHLLAELNEGVQPDEEDVNYVLNQFDDFTRDSNVLEIKEQDLRAAIISWYLFVEEKKAKQSKRDQLKRQQLKIIHDIMDKFDKSRTGTLNRDEVRDMCISITQEVAPNIEVLESDIDMVMQTAKGKSVISAQELPLALSSVLALRDQNAYFHQLFKKYDKRRTGFLEKHQLAGLITEFNEGNKPSGKDLQDLLCEFDQCEDGRISELAIKSAVMKWYFRDDKFKSKKSSATTKRDIAREHQLYYIEKIMETFDMDRTGTLNRDEVHLMCSSIVKEVAPKIEILDSDIDMIMRVGGDNVKAEITVQELPEALASTLALQTESAYFHQLFMKHDKDHSGYLPKDQLRNLITEINEGVPPTEEDLRFVINKFDNLGNIFGEGGRVIHEDELRAAIINWYFKAEEHQGVVRKASLMGAASLRE